MTMKTIWITAAAATFSLMAPAGAQPPADETWYSVASRHFVVHTNAAHERGAEIAASLERFRSVFAQLAPEIELSSPAPTTILAFRDAESYRPYKSPSAGRGVLGQFLSHPDGNYITLDAGSPLVGSFVVIQHEYVHFFVRHNFPGVPRWFNEGLAEYYSTFATDGERALVGRPVERHLHWFQRRQVSLDGILDGKAASGGHGRERQAGHFYATSWLLVHYLLSGESRQLDRAADYFVRLRAGEDPEEAFEEAFDLRLRQLEERLAAYLGSGELPEATIPLASLPAPRIDAWVMRREEVLNHLGDLLAHMRRTPEAERHFQRALDVAGEDPEAHAGLALVRDLQNRFTEADLLFADAVRLGSIEPLTYVHYGRHLLRRAGAARDSERAKLAGRARFQLSRAVDVYPGFGAAWALLGAAHLMAGDESKSGVQALERAIHLLPDRPDLVFDLARAHLHRGRIDVAEEVVEEQLAPRAPPRMTALAREAVARARLLAIAEAAFEGGEPETGLEYYDRAVSLTSDAELREQMEQKLLELQERFR